MNSPRRSHRNQAASKPPERQAPVANVDGGAASPSAQQERWRIYLAVVLIAVLGWAAFANSLDGVFVLDDVYEIEQNPEMSYLLPPWRAALAGQVIPARPIPYYTFAIDTALWKRQPRGYHYFNIAIHLGSSLFLFGISRRTLQTPKLAERFAASATTLAFLIAAVWVVHPLQTQAVTYVYQRLESLMSFLFLAAFYCFVRSSDSAQPNRWLIGSFAFTLAAVMSKESACAIPPLLFLYDVVFWTDSWRATLSERSRFYIAMFLTYIPLAVLVLSLGEAYEEFRTTRSSLGYALSQPIILLRYLQLCFYPTEQCLDYLWQRETVPHRIVGPLLVVGGLFVAGVVGLKRRRPWGWLIAAFFLPLLPTSSFIPVNDLANEHRMYLALGAVSAAIVLAGFAGFKSLTQAIGSPRAATAFGLVAAAVIVVLSLVTHERNKLYHDRVKMWEDVIAKAPHNIRGYQNLGTAYLVDGRPKEAAEAARRVIGDPHYRHRGYLILGSALLELGDRRGAIENLAKAIELYPDSPQTAAAYVNMAVAVGKSNPELVAQLYAEALRVNRHNIAALLNVANARARVGDYVGAEEILRHALEIAPQDPRIAEKLKVVLADKRAGS